MGLILGSKTRGRVKTGKRGWWAWVQKLHRCYAPPQLPKAAHTIFFFFNRLTHHNSRLLCVTRGGGEIDLAQSKCCQEDWMILLRQGVLWSNLMRHQCVCVGWLFAKGLWVQPPRAICPVMLGHMWPLQTWDLDYNHNQHRCECVHCVRICVRARSPGDKNKKKIKWLTSARLPTV